MDDGRSAQRSVIGPVTLLDSVYGVALDRKDVKAAIADSDMYFDPVIICFIETRYSRFRAIL